jgi:GNAT superfamily N-acetyltransferase
MYNYRVSMPAPDPIIPLAPSQKSAAVEIICRAFENDPAGVYAAPALTKRRPLLSWYARTGLALGFTRGDIFTNSRLTGVAVWLRPGCADLSLWAFLQTGILPPFQAGPTVIWRFVKAMNYFAEVHGQYVTEPHWYLLILTVAPAHQGQGLGSRLIQPILDRAAAAGLPCYLETANPRAVPFYEKHGFEVIYQAHLPDGLTPFWGLRRQPR